LTEDNKYSDSTLVIYNVGTIMIMLPQVLLLWFV